MGTRGDQIGNRGARVTTFDQTLTNQDSIGARTGIGQ
jgi:hypothetical protein